MIQLDPTRPAVEVDRRDGYDLARFYTPRGVVRVEAVRRADERRWRVGNAPVSDRATVEALDAAVKPVRYLVTVEAFGRVETREYLARYAEDAEQAARDRAGLLVTTRLAYDALDARIDAEEAEEDEVAHPRVGRPGCTCTISERPADPEVGMEPLDVEYDEACPFHGRQADPEGWAAADAEWPDADLLLAAQEAEEAEVDPIYVEVSHSTAIRVATVRDLGLVARKENGSLYVAFPANLDRVYAEDWRLVDDAYAAALDGEVEGLVRALLDALA